MKLKTEGGVGQPMPLTDLQTYNKTLESMKHLLKMAFWGFALPFWIVTLGFLALAIFILWQIMYYDVLTHAIRYFKG